MLARLREIRATSCRKEWSKVAELFFGPNVLYIAKRVNNAGSSDGTQARNFGYFDQEIFHLPS